MTIKVISKDDFFCRFFVKEKEGNRWDVYYKTIEALRPLFKKKDFIDCVNGFYLSIQGDFDIVRISYFVDDHYRKKATSVFRQYFIDTELIEIKHSPPRKIVLAKKYGGHRYEERFRTFLNLGTQIGLDLIKGNLLHARQVFAVYRWQVRKASLSFKKHFEPAFKKYSPTFNALSTKEKESFFADLEMWPNPPQVDWAHMMVNMVLGCDWNVVFGDPNYLTPGRPLHISKINKIVEPIGFQIPKSWKP